METNKAADTFEQDEQDDAWDDFLFALDKLQDAQFLIREELDDFWPIHIGPEEAAVLWRNGRSMSRQDAQLLLAEIRTTLNDIAGVMAEVYERAMELNRLR